MIAANNGETKFTLAPGKANPDLMNKHGTEKILDCILTWPETPSFSDCPPCSMLKFGAVFFLESLSTT